jgi:hypothetical protein
MFKILFLAFLATSLCLGQEPKWMQTREFPNYPASEYFLGAGSGTGDGAEKNAEQSAQADIVSQIRILMPAQINNVQDKYHLGDDDEVLAAFRIKTICAADSEISGTTIVATKTNPVTSATYVLEALNKLQFARNIESQIADGKTQASVLVSSSATFLKQGRVTDAIKALRNARQIIIGLLSKIVVHDAVSNVPYETITSLAPAVLTSDIKNIIAGLKVEKKGGDMQQGKVGGPFPQPFTVAVLDSTGSGVIPAQGVEISFLSSSGTVLGTLVTDSTGTARFSTTVTADIGLTIRAQATFPVIKNEFEQDLEASSTQFTFSTIDADVAFSVRINLLPGPELDTLRSAVDSALSSLGYQVVDMSRYELVVSWQPSPATVVNGPGGTNYFVTAATTIFLEDKQTGRTIGTIAVKSSGSGSSEKEADQKAAGITIDTNSLLDLLQQTKM